MRKARQKGATRGEEVAAPRAYLVTRLCLNEHLAQQQDRALGRRQALQRER